MSICSSNTKKSSLYSQSLLIFIHKTPVAESHPTTREIKRFTTAQVDTIPMGNTSLFLHEQLAYLLTGYAQKRVSNIASVYMSHLQQEKLEIYYRPGRLYTDWKHSLFYMSSSLIYILDMQRREFQT